MAKKLKHPPCYGWKFIRQCKYLLTGLRHPEMGEVETCCLNGHIVSPHLECPKDYNWFNQFLYTIKLNLKRKGN